MIVLPKPSHWELPPHGAELAATPGVIPGSSGRAVCVPVAPLAHPPEGMPVDVTLEASGDEPSWLQLDRERLSIGGTAPLVAEDRTYRLIIRAHAEQGGDSRLLVWLTIIGQPDRVTLTPQLPGHWTW